MFHVSVALPLAPGTTLTLEMTGGVVSGAGVTKVSGAAGAVGEVALFVAASKDVTR